MDRYDYLPYDLYRGLIPEDLRRLREARTARAHAEAELIRNQAYAQYLKNQGLADEAALRTKETQQKMAAIQAKIDAAHKAAAEKLYANLVQHAAPTRLAPWQFDHSHDLIHWTKVLRHKEFEGLRFELDKLFLNRTPENSGAGSQNCEAIKKACDQMHKILQSEAGELSQSDYISNEQFIKSLAYEAQFPRR